MAGTKARRREGTARLGAGEDCGAYWCVGAERGRWQERDLGRWVERKTPEGLLGSTAQSGLAEVKKHWGS